jgi:hypothetical protein
MWSGLAERIARSDLHVVLDSVRIGHRSFTNRNRIRSREGWTWLSVPVVARGENAESPIERILIDVHADWQTKHLRTLEHAYGRAAHFASYASALRDLYARPYERIAEVCAATTAFTLQALAIETRLVTSTNLKPAGTKSELILAICRMVGASTYLSGPMGRDYLDLASFAAAGIDIVYHDFVQPEYPQAQPGAFQPSMAALDLILNCGPEARSRLDIPSRS